MESIYNITIMLIGSIAYGYHTIFSIDLELDDLEVDL